MNKVSRTLQGKVAKISGANTVSVEVESRQSHPVYKRVIKRNVKYLAHAANASELTIGDLVTITETKPVSKRKTWLVTNKLTTK